MVFADSINAARRLTNKNEHDLVQEGSVMGTSNVEYSHTNVKLNIERIKEQEFYTRY